MPAVNAKPSGENPEFFGGLLALMAASSRYAARPRRSRERKLDEP